MQNPAAKLRNMRTPTPARKVVAGLAGLVAIGLIGVLDYLTGLEISFGVFYFLPIWLLTWNFNRWTGALCSVLCAVVWWMVSEASGVNYSSWFVAFWNAAARLVYFLTFTYLVSMVREKFQRSEKELKRLRSLLPICSSCKKIRDDNGSWQEIEEYLSKHSGTDFSHGICPECTKKMYPEISDELLKKWNKTGT
jgi:hypothetical protein